MKQINGCPHNINEEVIGRITFGNINIFGRSKSIFVGSNLSKVPYGYAAAITNGDQIKSDKPYVSEVSNTSEFTEGDVVLINKKGEIVFLYEKKSLHNAIFVTERCNHRCIMCPQPPVANEADKTPLNLELISLMSKDTPEVGITGGEPTLVGDKLFEIIRHIGKCMPNASISMLSNGVRFADKSFAMKLAMCNCHDLQVDVPIFSDIAAEHNKIVGANTFYKTVQGLYNLALFHIQIGLRIVVHKLTYRRLPQLADYIYHNFPFVSQVAFLQMETIGLADKNLNELWIDPYEYNDELQQAVLLLSNRGICTKIYNAQLCVLPENIRTFACNSISDWKDTYLNECIGCSLKEKCGGLFESNQKHHSSHIKPIPKYKPMPAPYNGIQTISEFVQKNLTQSVLDSYTDPIIYDILCGYGRHTEWLANLGYKVVGYDLDEKAILYVKKWAAENSRQNVTIDRRDIDTISESSMCDILLNIHLYTPKILEHLLPLVKKGGLCIIETPELHGENAQELPLVNQIRTILSESGFTIKEYIESQPHDGRVSVKAIAQRI
jgi:His-Xaa-Ser system radical SAM maturase HxsC